MESRIMVYIILAVLCIIGISIIVGAIEYEWEKWTETNDYDWFTIINYIIFYNEYCSYLYSDLHYWYA